MTKKQWILLACVLVYLVITYYFIFMRVGLRNAYTILGRNQYGGMDKGYLIARAKALKAREEKFSHDGKNYATSTGKKIA